jgi:hypothetical protein
MPLHRTLEPTLLLLSAACLLFGGGVGCDPQLDGVEFRPAYVFEIPGDRNSPKDWYMRFGGRSEPGDGWAVLPYPVLPPYGATARLGVFLPDASTASEGAEGCIGFREKDLSDEFGLCVRYYLGPARLGIYTYGISSETGLCLGTRADLDLQDNGTNLVLRYRCEGDVNFTELDTVASRHDEGERWFFLAGAYGVMKGGEVGFDDLRLASNGPFAITPEGEAAWYTFVAFDDSLDAFYELEDGDLSGGADQWEAASGLLASVGQLFDGEAVDFGDSDAFKLWVKGGKGFVKSASGFSSEKPDRYFKLSPKFLDAFACSISEMEPFLVPTF